MEKKLDSDVDILKFEIINPKGKEDWADDYDASEAVEIYINGREIIELLKEIETPLAMDEGHIGIAGAYGHLTPKQLYSELNDIEESALLCCGDCGFIGCWSIFIRVEMDKGYVYWKEFRNNHRDWKYNVSYKFNRQEYENALKTIAGV